MKNTGAEGSSSNPNNPQQPADQSSGGNTNTSSPHSVSSPLQRPPMAAPLVMGRPGHSAFRAYRPQGPQRASSPLQRPPVPPPPPPPVMGQPGHSAFRPYRPQGSQPQWQFPGGGGSSGVGAAGASSGNVSGGAFFGAQAIPVGGIGAGGGSHAAGGVEIGNPMIRKRVREGAAGARAGAGGNQGGGQVVGGIPFQCRVCGKQFPSAKALFGHMRQHPDRGWKGAFPPPSFRAEEEFADVAAHLNPGREAAELHVEPTQADAAAQAEMQEVGEGGEEAGGDGDGDGAGGPQNYKVPDLNYEPPQDDNDAV